MKSRIREKSGASSLSPVTVTLKLIVSNSEIMVLSVLTVTCAWLEKINPKDFRNEMFDITRYGYKASATPGTVSGLLDAHAAFGKLPLNGKTQS